MSYFFYWSFIEKNSNDTLLIRKDKINESNQCSNEYLWLLFLDLLIFCFLTYITYNSSKTVKEEFEDKENYIPKSIKWLFYSILLRTISIILIILIKNPIENSPLKWFNIIFHLFPSFIFTFPFYFFSVFLSEVYYINLEYNNNFLRPILLCFIGVECIILFFLSFITLFAGAYKTFFYISEFLNGFLYIVLSLIILFYGRKVSKLFNVQKTNLLNYVSNEISKKLNILSNTLGLIFLFKGLISLYISIKKINIIYSNVFDFFSLMLFEIIPIIIYIIMGKINIPTGNSQRINSTYEMEYSNSFRLRKIPYKPPIFQ